MDAALLFVLGPLIFFSPIQGAWLESIFAKVYAFVREPLFYKLFRAVSQHCGSSDDASGSISSMQYWDAFF